MNHFLINLIASLFSVFLRALWLGSSALIENIQSIALLDMHGNEEYIFCREVFIYVRSPRAITGTIGSFSLGNMEKITTNEYILYNYE